MDRAQREFDRAMGFAEAEFARKHPEAVKEWRKVCHCTLWEGGRPAEILTHAEAMAFEAEEDHAECGRTLVSGYVCFYKPEIQVVLKKKLTPTLQSAYDEIVNEWSSWASSNETCYRQETGGF